MCFSPYERESRKFLPVKSGILGFGIGNTPQGIRNPTDKHWFFTHKNGDFGAVSITTE